MNPVSAGLSADEDHGRTSEEEEGAVEQGYERQVSGGGMRKRVKAREKVVYLAPWPANWFSNSRWTVEVLLYFVDSARFELSDLWQK